MRLYLKIFILNLIYFAQAKNLLSNGYHQAVGIKRAQDLMNLERSASRIVGGTQTSAISLYPYQAGMVITLRSNAQSICGGSLVSNTRVLTAAHCWWDGQNQATQFVIVLGSLLIFSGGTRITTTDVRVHPNWNADIKNDIAIAIITRVEYNTNIQAISLPTTSDVNQDFAGLSAVATGYGKITDGASSSPSTSSLYHINLNILTNVQCQKSFDITLDGSHLCTDGAKGVGTCDGDSGGPLTVLQNNKRILVGIVSFGLAEKCEAGYPSVYTRVTSFLTWIQANL
ncbi:unnamed protein product, partial [Brenthis ino]